MLINQHYSISIGAAVDTKCCRKCGEEKLLVEFYAGAGKLGRRATCKTCMNAYTVARNKTPEVKTRTSELSQIRYKRDLSKNRARSRNNTSRYYRGLREKAFEVLGCQCVSCHCENLIVLVICADLKSSDRYAKWRFAIDNPDKACVLCRNCWMKRKNPLLGKRRKELLEALGGVCVKCGCDDLHSLDVDHIHGGGGKLRSQQKEPRGATGLLPKLMRGELVDVQLLCANCNYIKAVENNELTGPPRKPLE